MIFRKIHFFVFILLLQTRFFAVNDSCLKIDKQQWQKIANENLYNEAPEKTAPEKSHRPLFDLGSTNYSFEGFKYVFYILVAGCILFLIVKIAIATKKPVDVSVNKNQVYNLSTVEEKMFEIDLDKILNDALVANDYRLALRINFLIVIKLLAQSGKINWAKEKTNWEYFNEIKDFTTAIKFKEIVLSFEPIWYGELSVNQQQFQVVQPFYEILKTELATQ